MNGLNIHLLIRKVDLLTLKLFLAAIEERQIGRAAARENIVASAATKRIQDLEDLADTKLLERNPKGVLPTPAGQVLARHIRRIFDSLDDMRRDIGEFSDGIRGQVRISATPGSIIQFLAHEIAEFSRNFPLVDVELLEETNPEVLRAVVTGNVDIAVFIASDDLSTEGLDVQDYRSDRIVALVPQGHRLSKKSSVSTTDLLEENFVGITPSTTMMGWMRDSARKSGGKFVPKYNVNSVEAARSLVRAGLGVAIQPGGMLMVEEYDRLVVIPIAEPWALRRIQIATQSGRPLSTAMRTLIRQFTDQQSTAAPSGGT